jgi:putative polyhydroxyalkanoate system protein
MPKVDIEIPHGLSVEDARARLEKLTPKIEQEYAARCRWEGERRMLVSRKGLNVTMDIEPDRVRVHMELGLLLGALSGRIRDGITRQLSELLA